MGIVLAFVFGIALAIVAIATGYGLTYFAGLFGIAALLGLYFAGREVYRRRTESKSRADIRDQKPLKQFEAVPVTVEARHFH